MRGAGHARCAGAKTITLDAARIDPPVEDPVSNVLKWVLLVVAKGGFQKADLMDYGSLYGMGSYTARTTQR